MPTTTIIMEVDQPTKSGAPAGCRYVDAKSARMQYASDIDVDVSLQDVTEQYIVPVNGINPDGPFEFAFDPIQDTALCMDKMYMYMRAQVVDQDTGVTYTDATDVCAVNFLLNTLWRSVECRVNGEALNLTASQHTGHKALIQAFTSVDANAAGNLLPSLFTPETSSTSSTSLYPGVNASTKQRRQLLNLGKGSFELTGPICGVDFLTSDQYLAPFNTLNLKFFRQDDAFIFNAPVRGPGITDDQLAEAVASALPDKWAEYVKVEEELAEIKKLNDNMGANETVPTTRTAKETKLNAKKVELAAVIDAKKALIKTESKLTPVLKIKELGIYCRRVSLTPSALKSYFQPSGRQIYSGYLTDMHTHTLTTGIDHCVLRLATNNVVPKNIVVGMTLTTAAKGHYQLNPFDFKHFDLSKIALKVNGIRVPQEPLEVDFDKSHIMRAYVHTQANCGRWRTEVSNSITPANFVGGVTLFAFDLTPDGCNGQHIHAGKEGPVHLELTWAKELKQQITVFVYTVKDQVVTLDPSVNGGAPEASAF